MLVYILWVGLSLGLLNLAVDAQRHPLQVRVRNRAKSDGRR